MHDNMVYNTGYNLIHKNERIKWGAVVLIGLYMICSFTSYIASYHYLYTLIITVCVMMYTGYAFIKSIRSNVLFITAATLLLVSFLYRIIGVSTAEWGNYGNRFLMFAALWIGYYIWNFLNSRTRKALICLFLIIISINVIDNIRIYSIYPDIIPTLRGTAYFERTWGKSNIGNTAFKYIVFYTSLMLFARLINDKNKQLIVREKFFLIGITILTAVFTIAYSTTGTIVISFFLTNFLVLLFGNSRDNRRYIEGVLLIIFVFVLFIVFAEPIMDYFISIARNLSGDKVALRLTVIKNYIIGDVTSSDEGIFARLNYIRIDLNTWFRNPLTFLFGNGYHTSSVGTGVLNAALQNGDGNHSGFIDLIARYGLIGLILEVSLIKFIKRYLESFTIDSNVALTKIFFWVLFLNNIFNNMYQNGIIFTIMILMPYLTTITDNQMFNHSD